MRRYILPIFWVAAALASCTRVDIVGPEDDAAWMYDETKPVPIEFSADQTAAKVLTKAMIDKFANTPVGIVGARPKWESVQPVWTPEEKYSTILNNARATVTADGKVSFVGGPYYYPFSKDCFSFYAYHPYNKSASLNEASDAWTVIYDISNPKNQPDILWAVSEAEEFDNVKGFNAKYIRTLMDAKEPGYRPAFEFNHCLAALEFKAQLAKDVSKCKFSVRKIVVLNTATKAELVIFDNKIDRSAYPLESTEAGKVKAAETGNISIVSDKPVAPASKAATVGSLMVVPQNTYKIVIYVSSSDGQTEEQWQYTAPKTLMPAGSSSFKAGEKYIVNLLFKETVKTTKTACSDDSENGINNNLEIRCLLEKS